jgi:hypothetical protein
MVHEGGVGTVQIQRRSVNVPYHCTGFLVQTSSGGIIPEAPSTLLRFGELEVTARRALEGMAGIDYRTPELGGSQLLQAD